MGIFRIARYFAVGLLLIPAGLVLLWLAIAFLPGAATFLGEVVWGLLGQISSFSLASAILQGFLSFEYFSLDSFLSGFLALLFGALSDSLIVACCIFAVKAFFTSFDRRWAGRFTRPKWLLTLIGVVIGVSICLLKKKLGGNWNSILTLVCSLACYITGLVLLLRGPSLFRGGTYSNRRAGFILQLLLGILGDLFDACCSVFILTAILQGPIFVKAGGNLVLCLLWIVLSALLMFFCHVVMELFQPAKV